MKLLDLSDGPFCGRHENHLLRLYPKATPIFGYLVKRLELDPGERRGLACVILIIWCFTVRTQGIYHQLIREPEHTRRWDVKMRPLAQRVAELEAELERTKERD